jgi:hypothetical protein
VAAGEQPKSNRDTPRDVSPEGRNWSANAKRLELLRDLWLVNAGANSAGRLGDFFDDESYLLLRYRTIGRGRARYVGLRDDPEAATTRVDDRYPAHLQLGHLLLDITEVVVRSATRRPRRHQLAEGGA